MKPAEVKTRSILSPRGTMEMSPHPNDISVRSVHMSVPWSAVHANSQRCLAELMIRGVTVVRNRVFFEPLLQLQADKPLA